MNQPADDASYDLSPSNQEKLKHEMNRPNQNGHFRTNIISVTWIAII